MLSSETLVMFRYISSVERLWLGSDLLISQTLFELRGFSWIQTLWFTSATLVEFRVTGWVQSCSVLFLPTRRLVCCVISEALSYCWYANYSLLLYISKSWFGSGRTFIYNFVIQFQRISRNRICDQAHSDNMSSYIVAQNNSEYHLKSMMIPLWRGINFLLYT